MSDPKVGCTCDQFQTALRDGFVELRAEKLYLADRDAQLMGGWSRLYGPEILHCPFCGKKLNLKAS